MAKKDEQTTSKEVNMHKRIAMGEKVTGMKKGGKVDAESAEGKMKKMACGGMMKKGGKVKK